ncbi:hypothetical protein N7474_011050 [Penicillium riverlandense]|uniref:uncharacterized protein n=1 Tax=Penicillium riverlandense TaxID=1903569 RepID=UPI0025476555|nr:uncharacterized protein N7474_011050 [Penicillium riverlandense]KAJ5805163.1 hypothetical protein N7474_011050 [Penicillium riverlandense]
MILIQSIYRPGSLNGNQKALIYAIYFSGIASMSDDEVQNLFGMTKDTSLMAYRSSTEEALAQGIFLNLNEDLIALQALVLFLSVSRLIGEAGVSWKLTGIARRSAIFNKPDLSSFEHELRKRLWCQLWYLDHRAARDLGQDDGSDMVPIPDLPLNINDSDLNPDSSTPATPCTGWTEQTFSLVRFQIAIARQRVSRDIPTETKKQIIQACQTRVEDLYLQYCTSSKDPIQWLTRHVAHVLIMEMWFELYSADTLTISVGPQKCAYKYEQRVQDFLFLQAIDIVDTAVRLEGEPQSRQWAWLLKGYQQFRPLVFLLNELHYRQECTAVSRAWMVVESALVRCQGSPNGKFLARLEERAHTIRLRITDSSSDAVQSSYIAPT